MTDDAGAPAPLGPTLSRTTVYEEALAAALTQAEQQLQQAQDRLATPQEIEPLRHGLAVLRAMRPEL